MAPTLLDQIMILTPTDMERVRLQSCDPRLGRVHVCGFGPIASGIFAGELFARFRPQWAILLGIAGGMKPSVEMGRAYVFDSVVVDGVGAGSGTGFRSARAMGWSQLERWTAEHPQDSLPLALPDPRQSIAHGQLLTVCAATDHEDELQQRMMRYPEAVAEDMEGWSVALAGAAHGVPVSVVRGISNRAGNRRTEEWRIDEALMSAAELVWQLVGEIQAQGDAHSA